MKEKMISFNGEMGQAIYDLRKTQTRRPIKDQPFFCNGAYQINDKRYNENSRDWAYDEESLIDYYQEYMKCPFPNVGEVFLVREPAKAIQHGWKSLNGTFGRAIKAEYSDGTISDWIHRPSRLAPVAVGKGMPNGCFREAARTRCKVKRVWVERVQDIGEDDALHEGVWNINAVNKKCDEKGENWTHPSEIFKDLWQSIYKTWDANPWVWCCEFEVTP